MMKSISISLFLLLSMACSPANLHQEAYKEKAYRKEEDKEKAMEYYQKARLNAQFGRSDSALMLYDKAIELDETSYAPHLGKQTIYLSRAEYEKALQESEIVIKKKPDLAEEWAFTGMLHEWLGDSATAFNYYRKSLEIYEERIANPALQDDIEANRANRAFSLILLEEEAKGREEIQKLKDEHPDNPYYDELIKIDKEEYMKMRLERE